MDNLYTLQDFKNIVDMAEDGYMIGDGQGRILYTNKAYIAMVSKGKKEMVGRNMAEYIRLGDMERSSLLTAIEQKKEISIFSIIRDERAIVAHSVPVLDSAGNVEKVYTRVKDYTEIEALKHKVDQMEQLVEKKELMADNYGEFGPNTIAFSDKMRKVFGLAEKIKDVDTTVIIRGESGVGKDVVARYIHQNGVRKNAPFVAVNCSALSEQLLETELFGYVGGTFTGANKEGKKGIFEAAAGGVLFLDEIGDISPALQVKLLRALESKRITRVGDYKEIGIDVRIITATNKDLEQMVKNNKFRRDLYYRLNVVSIHIPPLRERRDDIIPLSLFYLQHYNRLYSMRKTMGRHVRDLLYMYEWPGNIRELKNVVERMIVTSEKDELIAGDLDFLWQKDGGRDMGPGEGLSVSVNEVIPLEDAVSMVEKQLLLKAKMELGSSRKMAEALKVDHTTISRKMRKYKIKMKK